jgi:hypothetical protein
MEMRPSTDLDADHAIAHNLDKEARDRERLHMRALRESSMEVFLTTCTPHEARSFTSAIDQSEHRCVIRMSTLDGVTIHSRDWTIAAGGV